MQYGCMTDMEALSAPALPEEGKEHKAGMSSQLHFLVVDDQSVVRCIAVALLNALGYQHVSEAENGEEALALLRSGKTSGMPFNFVVTDWNMPVMDGLTLLKTIRTSADLRNLPVLMITSVAEQHNITFATQAGADGYILKPSLNVTLLKQTINDILMNRDLPT